MKKLFQLLRPALISYLIMTIICGFIYTITVTGFANALFQKQANGSIISILQENDITRDYGSLLIAQEFTSPKYLIGRPSGITNLSPVSIEQDEKLKERIAWLLSLDPDNKSSIPIDLIVSSASGVDPNITPEAAEYQVKRIAKIRGIKEETVRMIVNKYTTTRFLGFLGEPAVNVLQVNLALDGLQ